MAKALRQKKRNLGLDYKTKQWVCPGWSLLASFFFFFFFYWELAASDVILLVEEEFTTSSNCHGKQRHGGILKVQFKKKKPAWLIKKPAWPFLSYIPVAHASCLFCFIFAQLWWENSHYFVNSKQWLIFHFHFLNFHRVI